MSDAKTMTVPGNEGKGGNVYGATASIEDAGTEGQDESAAPCWGSMLREFRHSPCMMRPISIVMIFLLGMFLFVTLIFQCPALLLGFLLSPVLKRNSWYVEFLYPMPIGRWAHLLLMSFTSRLRHKARDKNRGFHSRTVEQKIEVVPGRVNIHFLPQWLDNVGYLIVCLPEPTTVDPFPAPPVGLIIDCGEMDAVVRSIELIQEYHYNNKPIRLTSILSTHKHHDHTGGNSGLLKHPMGENIIRVFGGAVEQVPCCTDQLVDGEKVELPRFELNDMNELVEIEAIAVPAHTRGSLVYCLRSKLGEQVEYMFTGDTMFSGGAGVPFEADVGVESDKQLSRSNGNTRIRGNLGTTAMERCFTQVISRAMPNDLSFDAGDRILIFPGHEYTQDLLVRQFQNTAGEFNKWKSFTPRDYFETVSHMYVAFHRRSLPHNSGRLLLIPSTLQREVHINTHMRSLRRSADLVVRAVTFWHDNFCTQKEDESQLRELLASDNWSNERDSLRPNKSPSGFKSWNIDVNNIKESVFTTVYTADLNAVIEDLGSGKIKKEKALEQLQSMKKKMDIPVVNKRAIPGFLPSDKNIYRGICGLAILGSRPSAITFADSRRMKMPPPMDHNSDKILVSMKRLILVLTRLGLTINSEGEDVSSMIKKLWKEANEYCNPKEYRKNCDAVDLEYSDHWHDEIELGMLKWLMYGVSANQPSWFSKIFCMPCSKMPKSHFVFPDHPASKMDKKSGDLVSHDVLTCYLCRNVTVGSNDVRTCSFDSHSLNSVSAREAQSDQSCLSEDGNGCEVEITQSILKERTVASSNNIAF